MLFEGILVHPLAAALLSVACCFLASSWVLSRWPHLLHSKKGGPGGSPLEGPLPVCIAHRGGQAEAPENTIEAFRYSLEECKCEMIELDVWLSKDRKLVVVHDDDLFRVTGIHTRVSDLDFACLPNVLPSKEIEQQGGFFEFTLSLNLSRSPLAQQRFRC